MVEVDRHVVAAIMMSAQPGLGCAGLPDVTDDLRYVRERLDAELEPEAREEAERLGRSMSLEELHTWVIEQI